MLDIDQPKDDDSDEDETYDKVLPHENNARNQPIIPVSPELNEPIVEWVDNITLLTGAFPDRFLFGRSAPNGASITLSKLPIMMQTQIPATNMR